MNSTLIRDNLYPDNPSMNLNSFHDEFYSAMMHVNFPVCIIWADLKVLGSRPNLHFPAYRF